jgi:hypothetical protein
VEGAYFEPLSYIEARVELVPSLPLLHNLAMQSGILVVPVQGGFLEIWSYRNEELWGIFIILSKHACVISSFLSYNFSGVAPSGYEFFRCIFVLNARQYGQQH